MHHEAYLFAGTENSYRQLTLFLAVSTVCHLVLFVLFIFSSSYMPARKKFPSVINVNLVSFSPQVVSSIEPKNTDLGKKKIKKAKKKKTQATKKKKKQLKKKT